METATAALLSLLVLLIKTDRRKKKPKNVGFGRHNGIRETFTPVPPHLLFISPPPLSAYFLQHAISDHAARCVTGLGKKCIQSTGLLLCAGRDHGMFRSLKSK